VTFGLLPFGNISPWGGAGTISLITILAIGTNELVAFFTSAPKCVDPLGYRDARNPLHWAIVPVDPIDIGFGGEVIVEPGKRRPTPPGPWIAACFRDPEDSTQVHIITATQLETGIDYDVTLSGSVRGAACETFAGLSTFRVTAVNRPPLRNNRIAAQDTYRDYANPPFEIVNGQLQPGPGFWQYDEAGEIVLDDAAASLKKRVIRRITTLTGGFVHLPAYGVPSQRATIARAFQVQALAIGVREQILQEPDVRAASVTGSVEVYDAGGIVRLDIRVQPKSIGEVSFLVQVPATF